MSLNETAVIEALRPVQDPELHRSIVDLGMVRDVVVDGTKVALTVVLTIPGCPLKGEITGRVNEALGTIGVTDVDLAWGAMNDEERAALRQLLHGDPASTAGSQQAHGHAEGRAIPFADPSSRTRVLLIASGKGGVGKSSVTTNLAVALAQRGKRVGIVDADVWGFSIPKMLGVDRAPVLLDQMIVPPEVNGVSCISMGFFAEEDQAVIWRGPMLHSAVRQFLFDVAWSELDYLVVDLPPGTGDAQLSLSQQAHLMGAVIVTTPQDVSVLDVKKAIRMFQTVNVPILGIVENMAWFTPPGHTEKYYLFGQGGGARIEREFGVPLLGQIPIEIAVREGGDEGTPITVAHPNSLSAKALADIAGKVAQRVSILNAE